MGNPTQEATELNNKKSPAFLKAIAFIGAIVISLLVFVLMKGLASIIGGSFAYLSACAFYIMMFMYIFGAIRIQQKKD